MAKSTNDIKYYDTLFGLLEAAVSYLEQSQIKKNTDTELAGEWPSTIHCESDTYVGTKGKSAPDSNSFTITLIHGALSDVYLRMGGFENIPPMLNSAISAVAPFIKDNTVNFWRKLPYPLRTADSVRETPRPSAFKLEFADKAAPVALLFKDDRMLYAAANLANDEDDTAFAYLANKHHQTINGVPSPLLLADGEIGQIFSRFRNLPGVSDKYLETNKGQRSVGAFLTWFANDDSIGIIPDISFKTPYIPYGSNDTDCIVNANVLNVLATYDELYTDGVPDACEFVIDSFAHGEEKTCGLYYPSPYTLHYSAARAFYNGATCLESAVDMAVTDILYAQNPDGSWSSTLPHDDVHTSLYALGALLYSGKTNDKYMRQVIEFGLDYIIQNAKSFNEGSKFWEGGVMFSGGRGAFRTGVVWRSDAYTTALATDILSLYLYLFPQTD